MSFVIFNLDKKTKVFKGYQAHNVIPDCFKDIDQMKEYIEDKNSDPKGSIFGVLNTDENVFKALTQKTSAGSIKSHIGDMETTIDDLRWQIDSLVSFVEEELKKEDAEEKVCDHHYTSLRKSVEYCAKCAGIRIDNHCYSFVEAELKKEEADK